MNNRIALWHQCRYGNHFGSWADENIQCPACGVTEEMPKPRYLYETDGKDERPAHIPIAKWDEPFGGNRWEAGQIGGRQ